MPDIPVLYSPLTNAEQSLWARVLYPYQGGRSFGAVLQTALFGIDAPCVAMVDLIGRRLVITTGENTKSAIRALVPGSAAVCTPVLVYGQSATRWNLVSDAWFYAGGALVNLCLPQLSKRTCGAFVDAALKLAGAQDAFAVIDQADGGTVKLWLDFGNTSRPAMLALPVVSETVGMEWPEEGTLLPFEGGPT